MDVDAHDIWNNNKQIDNNEQKSTEIVFFFLVKMKNAVDNSPEIVDKLKKEKEKTNIEIMRTINLNKNNG